MMGGPFPLLSNASKAFFLLVQRINPPSAGLVGTVYSFTRQIFPLGNSSIVHRQSVFFLRANPGDLFERSMRLS